MSDAFIPYTLEEALSIMSTNRVIPFAGGTDLMVQHRREGGVSPYFEFPLLFLDKIEQLNRIETTKNKLIIGAGVLLKDLVDDDRIPDLLKLIARQMAAVTTRNVATIGGNISNASPAADTLPFLYIMNATLVLQNSGNVREVQVEDFITGPGQTCMQPDELLVEIHIPQKKFDVVDYRKVGTRKAMALSKISFAGVTTFKDGVLSDFRIAMGAVAPKVVRDTKLENRLTGSSKKEITGLLPEILKGYEEHIQPINDARSTKAYRKKVSLDMIRAFIEKKILENKKLK